MGPEMQGAALFDEPAESLALGQRLRLVAQDICLFADFLPYAETAALLAQLRQGAEGRFRLRLHAAHARTLEPGSVLMMRGDAQRACEHCMPRTRKPVGPRLNLTFRRVRRLPLAGDLP